MFKLFINGVLYYQNDIWTIILRSFLKVSNSFFSLNFILKYLIVNLFFLLLDLQAQDLIYF